MEYLLKDKQHLDSHPRRVHVSSVGSRALGSHRVHHGSLGEFCQFPFRHGLRNAQNVALKKEVSRACEQKKRSNAKKRTRTTLIGFDIICLAPGKEFASWRKFICNEVF